MSAFVFHVNHCSVSLSKLIVFFEESLYFCNKGNCTKNSNVFKQGSGEIKTWSSRWTRPKVNDVSYRPGRKHRRQGEEADGLLGETCPPPSCPCFHSALPMFPSVGCAQYLLRTLPALCLLSKLHSRSSTAHLHQACHCNLHILPPICSTRRATSLPVPCPAGWRSVVYSAVICL